MPAAAGILICGQIVYRSYRVGLHVVAYREREADLFVRDLRAGSEKVSIVGDPFQVDPLPIRNLGRGDLIYLGNLNPAPAEAAAESRSGTVICSPADCELVMQRRGEPQSRRILAPKGHRGSPVVARLY